MSTLRLFPRPMGPHCEGCCLLAVCGSERGDGACPPGLDFDAVAGPFHLHPLRSDWDEQFERVGGVLFDDIVGQSPTTPTLPAYLPQLRWRRERVARERLTAEAFPLLAIRLREVFRHDRVRGAGDVRQALGLGDDVELALLLHGADDLLERFDALERAAEIAEAGYVLVTPPSFSLWEPRRRPNNLLSLRRSFLSYGELASAGAPVCPRVGWVEPVDVERLADWVNLYAVTLVSLDLMTYSDRSFARAVSGLAYFDELTSGRVHYLIDGVDSARRMTALYLAAEAARVTVSNATLAPPPRKLDGASSFRARSAVFASRCAEAARMVDRAERASVERFIAEALTTRRQQVDVAYGA